MNKSKNHCSTCACGTTHLGRKEVSAYEIIDPILLRPAMYFGRPSVTAFFNFYFGVQHLGGCGHGGPFMYKLKDDLFNHGFHEWVCEKHDWARNIDTAGHYLKAAYDKLSAQGYRSSIQHKKEGVGWDLFVADLKEFREIPNA